jgi:hypothetical protein
MRSRSKPVQVQLVTKPPTKFAFRRAEPCIARMGLVDLVTVYVMSSTEMMECKKINTPGNITQFLTGIDFSTWECHPLEGARLAVHIVMNKSQHY